MKSFRKCFAILTGVFLIIAMVAYSPSSAVAANADKKPAKVTKTTKKGKVEKAIPGSMAEKVPQVNVAFDANKMSDMSDFDPSNPIIPTGDTIKIAVVWPFSGPGALNGEIAWIGFAWAAHDINKRGGIMVDGKKKLIEMIKADSMSKPDQAKKICERMVLQEKVNILVGTSGSNIQKIINETGAKYKIIALNIGSLSDDLNDATNFSRYNFMSSDSTEQIGRGMAYFYGQIRKKEKKFYILCQDYSFGHGLACLLYTSPSPRDGLLSRMPSSA